VLHAQKPEADASATASDVQKLLKEPSVQNPELEYLKKGDAREVVAVPDLENGVGVVAREHLAKLEAHFVEQIWRRRSICYNPGKCHGKYVKMTF
jgi:hypothetical protein